MADTGATESGHFAFLAPLIGPIASAAIGVLMRHARRAKAGKPLSLTRLALDLPSVVGLGIIGGALGDYWGLGETVRWGIAAVLGYLGPQMIDAVFARWLAGQPTSPPAA